MPLPLPPPPPLPPRARPLLALLLALLLTALLVVGVTPAAAHAGTAGGSTTGAAAEQRSRTIEGVPWYQPQVLCRPIALPGTRRLARYLQRRYPGTGSYGITRTCTRPGVSEHKDGRAFDWRVDVRNPRQRAQAAHFLQQLLAPDRQGNPMAMARRMGVMYVVWNRRIFSTYTPGWRPYGGSNPHVNHLHISLTWAGASGLTSWFSGRVWSYPLRPKATSDTATSKGTGKSKSKGTSKPGGKATRKPTG